MLTIDDLYVAYGEIEALHGVSIQVNEGEIVAIIGSNGAGKSTLLNTISGLLRPRQGKILFKGASLHSTRPDRLAAKSRIRR